MRHYAQDVRQGCRAAPGLDTDFPTGRKGSSALMPPQTASRDVCSHLKTTLKGGSKRLPPPDALLDIIHGLEMLIELF